MTYVTHIAAPNHWLFLLACGAVVNNSQASDDLQQTLHYWEIPYTFGFTAPSSNAHLASDFIANFGTCVIIENADLKPESLCKLLDMCYNLRRHGTLLLFCYKENSQGIWQEQYRWHHPKLQPGGIPLQALQVHWLSQAILQEGWQGHMGRISVHAPQLLLEGGGSCGL